MHLQRNGLVKQLLNINSNHVSFFGALLCFMYLNILLWSGGSEVAQAYLDIYIYIYIPRFIEEPLAMFCGTLVGKHCSRQSVQRHFWCSYKQAEARAGTSAEYKLVWHHYNQKINFSPQRKHHVTITKINLLMGLKQRRCIKKVMLSRKVAVKTARSECKVKCFHNVL
jgi:hypothetical protein